MALVKEIREDGSVWVRQIDNRSNAVLDEWCESPPPNLDAIQATAVDADEISDEGEPDDDEGEDEVE